MSELIDFKTRKVIKTPPCEVPKEEEKQKTISFLKDIIKELEDGKIDPEECIVMLKWKTSKESSRYQYWNNDFTLDKILGLIELLKLKIIKDW